MLLLLFIPRLCIKTLVKKCKKKVEKVANVIIFSSFVGQMVCQIFSILFMWVYVVWTPVCCFRTIFHYNIWQINSLRVSRKIKKKKNCKMLVMKFQRLLETGCTVFGARLQSLFGQVLFGFGRVLNGGLQRLLLAPLNMPIVRLRPEATFTMRTLLGRWWLYAFGEWTLRRAHTIACKAAGAGQWASRCGHLTVVDYLAGSRGTSTGASSGCDARRLTLCVGSQFAHRGACGAARQLLAAARLLARQNGWGDVLQS